MVRPDGTGSRNVGIGSCCIGLAGESPAAVSAGAPRSRPRASGEIPASERGVESPPGAVRLLRGEQVCGPSMKRTLQPRETRTRKQGLAELFTSQRRQQTAPGTGAVQDSLGVWRRARRHSPMWNRRGPTRWPTSGRSDPYKPTVKWGQTGRESEGSIVLMTPGENPVEGRGPALVTPASGGKCEGMVARPNNPVDKVRELQRRLFVLAKCNRKRRFHALSDWLWRGDVLLEAWKRFVIQEACMPHEKTIGKPYAGNPHVRFERGPQVVGARFVRSPSPEAYQ